MAEKEVTLRIKVQDTEVVKATGSVDRLNKATKDVGGEGTKALGGLQNATAGVAEGFGSIAAAAGPIAGILATAAAGFVAVTAKLADFAKQAAAFGSEIQGVATRTGLTAEAVQALKYAADSSGTSIDKIGDSIGKFNVLLGNAREGNKKAIDTLKSYGITTLESNAAVQQAIKTIYERETADRKAAAAAALFKDESGEIIPVIQKMNGSVSEQIKKLEDLGILIDGKSISSAKRYADQMKELERQLEAVKIKIGSEVVPTFLDMATRFSDWLSRNKGEIESWARTTALAFDRVITGGERLAKLIVALANRDLGALSTILADVSVDYDPVLRGKMDQTRKNDLWMRSFSDTSLRQVLADGTIPDPIEKAKKGKKPPFELSSEGRALVQAAETLGISPIDLATIISFETAGTFSPSKRGGAGNKYLGLIQFGPQEQQQFSANKNQSFEQQITTSVVKYFQTRFEKAGRSTQGASLLDLYTTVLAGNPNANPDARDAFGTSARSGVAKMVRDHRSGVLDRFFGGSQGNVPNFSGEDVGRMLSQRSDAITKAEQDAITQQIIDFYYHSGLVPNKQMAERIRQLLVERAKQEGEWQPGALDVIKSFEENRAFRSTTPLTDQGPGLSRSFLSLPETLDEEYVRNFRESLNLSERLTADVMNRRNMQALVNAEVESYRRSLDEAATAAEKEYQILLKRNLAAEAAVDSAFERNSLIREIGDLQKQIMNAGENDGLILQAERLRTILELRNRELDAVIRIERSQAELSRSMVISGNQIRAQIYEHLAGQRTLNEAIADGVTKTYDELGAKLDEQVDKMFEWAGAFKSLFAEPAKAFARNGLTQITKGLLDSIAPGLGDEFTKTQNPIARPIVDKLDETNKLLARLLGAAGGSASMGSFSLGGIFSGLFGGGAAGGASGGTPSFNPNASGSGSAPSTGGGLRGLLQMFGLGGNGSLDGINVGSGGFDPLTGTYSGSGGGGLFSRITGPGGIFGGEGFGNNAGTYGAIGAGAGIIGGLVGGRAGSIIGSVGGGLAMGAQIGSMIAPGIGTVVGAIIGAVGGLFAGLFGGDPKRKRDKEEKIPALNKGFTDAMAELRKILEDVRFLRTDPDEAVTRATEVRNQIASGFGIQFESKKYRNQAQTSIRGRLSEADGIIAQIKSAAEIARGAADRRERILPEFAGGHYFADFFKPNGLMPGVFDGKDNIFAMISRGEMVLNPTQMGRIRSLAGFDVFAGAGIPNYPNQSSSAKLATGGIAGTGLGLAMSPNIVVQPNMTLYLSGVAFEDGVSAVLESDGGRRTLVKVVKEEQKMRRI